MHWQQCVIPASPTTIAVSTMNMEKMLLPATETSRGLGFDKPDLPGNARKRYKALLQRQDEFIKASENSDVYKRQLKAQSSGEHAVTGAVLENIRLTDTYHIEAACH